MLPRRRTARAPLALAALATLAARCADAPLDRDAAGGHPNHNAPLGRLEGTIVYQGPFPALDGFGHPLGRVVLLLFDAARLPPPEGLATSAVSVQTLPASQLFANVTPLGNGAVRASAAFTFPGIPAGGVYQLRAFYSNRDAATGFDPVYGVRSQPVRGDVGGGAVADPSAASPSFIDLVVGTSDGAGGYTLPDDGAVVRNVTVFLGAPITADRPVFHIDAAGPSFAAMGVEARPAAPGAAQVDWAARNGLLGTSATAYELPSQPAATDVPSFIATLPTLALGGGVPDGEVAATNAAGVVFTNPVPFAVGTVFRGQHPTLLAPNAPGASPPVVRFPWVFPLALLVKLHEPTAAERALLASPSPDPAALARLAAAMGQPESAPGTFPTVIVGSVVPDTGLQDFASLVRPAPLPPSLVNGAHLVFPPVAFEVHGPDPARDWQALVPKLPPALAASLGALPAGSRCLVAGLPAGRWGLTLVTATGATWSLPNELAPLSGAPRSLPSAPSQGAFVRVVPSAAPAGNACPTGLPTQ